MFCPTCGAKLPDGSVFCEKCGARVAMTPEPPKKVVLDPKEVVEHKPEKDSSKTFAGNGRAFGIILMLLSVLGDLAAQLAVGSEHFIPITVVAAIFFVIGFLMVVFSPG